MQLLDQTVRFRPLELDGEPVVGSKAATLEGNGECISLTGLDVAERDVLLLPGLERQQPQFRGHDGFVVGADTSETLGSIRDETRRRDHQAAYPPPRTAG